MMVQRVNSLCCLSFANTPVCNTKSSPSFHHKFKLALWSDLDAANVGKTHGTISVMWNNSAPGKVPLGMCTIVIAQKKRWSQNEISAHRLRGQAGLKETKTLVLAFQMTHE